MENKRNKQVVLHKSDYDLSILKSLLLEKGFELIEARFFAEIKKELKGKELFAAFGVIGERDLACIEFMRSMMEYSPITQRVILTETEDRDLLTKAVNRSHIDYLLSFPITIEELEKYIRKIPRRYNRLNKPFEKFEVLSEVTEDLLNQNEKFREQASSDALTKLLNRRSFDSILRRFWENHLKKDVAFCMALLDLDFFKKVNDTYGHLAGDEVLRTIADILNSNQRSGIDFAFRYGGEEFAILSSATTLKEMELYITRLLKIIRNTSVEIGDRQEITVTISAGICSSDLSDSYEKLIEQTDESLYKAKETGRDRFVVFNKQKEFA